MYYIVNKGTKSYTNDAVIYASAEKRYCERFLKDGQVISVIANQGGHKVFVEA